ncbi:RNase H domain-containing protein [Trichonephila clavipes]|nr:RNase H domain-containing protein [Trichonephila clavipes]
MSVLEALENYSDSCDPVVCYIIYITSQLHGKGCDIQFCLIASHVSILGNEQADIAARSATTYLWPTVPLCDMKRVIQHHIDNTRQESWNSQTNNKLHWRETCHWSLACNADAKNRYQAESAFALVILVYTQASFIG